jgi:hypothetical protein
MGVYPSDRIPRTIARFPTSFVINSDKFGESGEHWLGIFIPNRFSVEYFDTFARQKAPAPIDRFLKLFPKQLRNPKKIQLDFETSCGPHVIYFIIQRSRGRDFGQIMSDLHRHRFPDGFVKLFTAAVAGSQRYK